MLRLFYVLILLSFTVQNVFAEDAIKWSMELLSGNAHNLPSRVTVKQKGYPEASKMAHWGTRPMVPAPYYSFRVGRWEDNKSIELEMLHHKIYMENTDEIFNQYNSTFGFNFFFLNRAWRVHDNTILRLGFGPVVSHPENMIRGQKYTSDVVYNLVGAGAQGSLQFRQNISKHFYFTQEIKVTYGMAELPIANGTSYVSNTALHGLIGLGSEF